MARRIGFGPDSKSDGHRSSSAASVPFDSPKGRRRAFLMLPAALILEAIGIFALSMGYVLTFAAFMVAGIAIFTTATVTIIRIARGRRI